MAPCQGGRIPRCGSERCAWWLITGANISQRPRRSGRWPHSEGVGYESLRRWVAQHEIDVGTRGGLTSEENAEIKRLRAENRRLREDNEILKQASIFFAGEPGPRNQ